MAASSESTKSSAEKPPRVTNITYTRPGIVAPVYITTSISDPPWVLTKMSLSRRKTSNGDPVFYQQYENVTPGLYQYKIRIGEDEWIVDDSQLKGFDGHGNLNNFRVVTENEPYAVTEEITAISNPDPSQSESPLLPHERFDSPQQPAVATHDFSQEPPPPEPRVTSPPKRTATLPLETIAESDEPNGSTPSAEQSPEARRSVADSERFEEDDELDNAILLPHEADEDERCDDASYAPLDERMLLDPQIVREEGTLAHEEIPTLAHEDIPPPPDEDETFLLPHERANRTPSEQTTDSDIMMPGPVHEDGDQIFDYEAALEAGRPYVYGELTPSADSRSPSPSHWLITDDGTSEPRGCCDQVQEVDGSLVNHQRHFITKQQLDTTEEDAQETDITSDGNGALSHPSTLNDMAHRMHNVAIFTPPQTPHRRPDVGASSKDGPEVLVTARHVYRQDSSKSTNVAAVSQRLALAASPLPSAQSKNEDPNQNYLQKLFRHAYSKLHWFFCFFFFQKRRETSYSILVVVVGVAVYRYWYSGANKGTGSSEGAHVFTDEI